MFVHKCLLTETCLQVLSAGAPINKHVILGQNFGKVVEQQHNCYILLMLIYLHMLTR